MRRRGQDIEFLYFKNIWDKMSKTIFRNMIQAENIIFRTCIKMFSFWISPSLNWTLFSSSLQYLRSFFSSSFMSCLPFSTRSIAPLTTIKNNQTNWGFATNSDFFIPISLQPDVVDRWYFKLWILLDKVF